MGSRSEAAVLPELRREFGSVPFAVRFVQALLLPALLVAGLARPADAQPACDATNRMQLENVLASGGTLALSCTGSIQIDETLVVDGVVASVSGTSVSITRDLLAPSIPLFDVRGGTLALSRRARVATIARD